ncbi:hypothetical protein H6F46_02610 [Limnothrix sp. FACHB-1083]|uniref:hypothetical protein n=1 Tax=unclassified Limnothrix TaxID=2632864 RepID=UPI0016813233|nr:MULTISPECIES: hypothetical protein [unclassified Limnothrix]MBD2159579.1 hypothetical protein [Limnothrix sp. FACHB-1083]MBD2190281.1 hypothetical protein [Limnothrix sp. FACHB-1088]
MSLNSTEIEDMAQMIYSSSAIRKKAVVLCEGAPSWDKLKRTPRSRKEAGLAEEKEYKKSGKLSDSSFYLNCLPRYLRAEKCPQFFSCGSRSNVIDIFHQLLDLHCEDPPSDSYLDINKLFAIVDLDLEEKPIRGSIHQSIEAIYQSIYGNRSGSLNLIDHRIYTTGLIHKEAYFMLPELKHEVFDVCAGLRYCNGVFDLNKIYLDLIQSISKDNRIKKHFSIVRERLKGYLSPQEIEELDPIKLQEILENKFQEHLPFDWSNLDSNEDFRKILTSAVLLIAKAKDEAWKKITDDSGSEDFYYFRISMEGKIATYFSTHHETVKDFHIMEILKFICEKSREP